MNEWESITVAFACVSYYCNSINRVSHVPSKDDLILSGLRSRRREIGDEEGRRDRSKKPNITDITYYEQLRGKQ